MLHLAAKQSITSFERWSKRFSTLVMVTGDQPLLHLIGTEKHQGLGSEEGLPLCSTGRCINLDDHNASNLQHIIMMIQMMVTQEERLEICNNHPFSKVFEHLNPLMML